MGTLKGSPNPPAMGSGKRSLPAPTRALFSRRLPWTNALNRLAVREAERRAAGATLLDLTVTNPTLVGIPYPEAALAAALADPGGSRYQPAPFGLPEARAAVAADYARRGAIVDPDAIVLTASSSESYALLFKLLADPGDAVLVPQPSYPLLEHLARLEGLTPRPYQLDFDTRWRIDFSTVDPRGARALCLVSPNNPTGSFTIAEDLERAGTLGLPLVVDEVFADYSFAPIRDTVAPAAARPLPVLTFSLGGLSKAAGLPHMKLGWIAASGPAVLVGEALHCLELVCDTYLSVSTPVQRALPRLLELGTGIRADIAARLDQNRRALATAAAGGPCTVLPAEAGWMTILRVPAVASDEDWALALLEQDDVLVHPGYFFDLAIGTTLVMSLLPEPAVFGAAVRRLMARAKAL